MAVVERQHRRTRSRRPRARRARSRARGPRDPRAPPAAATARASRCAGGTAVSGPPSCSIRRASRSAQRSSSQRASSPSSVGDSALSTPTTRSPTRSGRHSSATTDGIEGRKSGCAEVSDTSVATPVAERAADDAGRRRHAVVDLPVAAHRLAAQAAALLEVHARHQPGPGQVLDHDRGGVAHGRRGGDRALEAPARGRPRRAARGGLALGSGRPRLARAAEQPALAEVDLGGAQHLELLGPLDALGDDARADLAGERHGRAQHGLAGGVEVDVGDHAAAQLEEVGADLGDVLERREAGAGVVDGDQRAARDPRAQALLDAADVLDGVLLGELDHEPRGQAVGEPREARVPERVGRDVDEQQPARGRLAGLGHRGPAGDLDVVAQAGAGGGGERDVRRQRAPGRAGWGSGRGPRSRPARGRSGGRSAGTRHGSRRAAVARGSRRLDPAAPSSGESAPHGLAT